MKDVLNEIEKANIGKVEKKVSLSRYTTYKVGGIALGVVYPKNIRGLVKLIKILKNYGVKFKVLGNGSNVLFSDQDYAGIIIKLNEFNNVEFVSKSKVKVGAGFSLIKLSLLAAKKGLTGLEFASGIPGTVGGAIFMNAGAYKSDMGYVVKEVKVLTPDFRIITLENKELDFHYRSSFFQKNPGYICLEAIITLKNGDRGVIETVIKERRKRRIESQPLDLPSAGSVFRNPEGNFAGKLIEDLGYKGKMLGGAMISDKHANFIVNYNKASANDIKGLIEEVQEAVYRKYNIKMKIEQEFVNWE